jgi:hypothetical protein
MDPEVKPEANKNTSQGDAPEGDLDLEDSTDAPEVKPEPVAEVKAKPEAPESSELTSNLSEKSTEFANDVKESTTGALNKLNTFRETSSGKIIVMTIVGILVVGIVAFLLYYIIQQTMVSQASYQLAETASPVLCSQITACNGSDIPNPSSGVRSGMCFWIYIYDVSKYQGSVRHVFHRGLKTDGFVGDNTRPAGPYVALDPTTSSLYVTFGAGSGKNDRYYNYKTSSGSSVANNDLNVSSSQKLQLSAMSRGIVFPYIPLQRWVHVGVVVNENINGGTVTGYIDGELVLSVNQSTKQPSIPVTFGSDTTPTNITPVMKLTNMNISNTGDVYIGGSPSDPIGPGFSGLVSRLSFYNYDISAQDVYTNYQQGPINNPLAALGLPAYGLQSPVYKIS